MSQPSIGSIINRIVGQDFEIPCREMKLICRDNSPAPQPPLFQGPGYFRSDAGGEISFELLDQMARTPEETMALVSLLKQPDLLVLVEAIDYDGVDWSGSSLVPNVTWHETGQPVARGKFHQLSTSRLKIFTDTEINVTELHYGQKLPVPMTQLVEAHTLRADVVENKASWRDRHQFDFGGSNIQFQHLENPDRTIIRAGFRKGLASPTAEAWLDEALSFTLGWHVHHRVAVRYFEKDAILFVRKCAVQEKTGMPRPVELPPQTNEFWQIFSCYLAHCEKENQFNPPCALSNVWSEVLLASTGTVHAFVFGLVAVVESLARSVGGPVQTPNPDSVSSLRTHVDAWPGDQDLKRRALGMLTQLNNVSVAAILKNLEKEGVVSKSQITIWQSLRNKLAHGEVLDYHHADLPKWRDSLVDMAYRLALRQIGYQGGIFSHETRTQISFSWTSPTPPGGSDPVQPPSVAPAARNPPT